MHLTNSREAMELTAFFAHTAGQLRATEGNSMRVNMFEAASRIALLRAHLLAQQEQARRGFYESYRAATFATA